jgi:ABC-type Fe3+/spermidine/putrescine transport system ATPase subunit
MKDGRVLQVGRPKELYERPLTRFVADFVGTNNLLDGEVLERHGEELVVQTPVGALRAIPNGSVPGRCVLAIRPENIAIAPAGAGAGNVVKGRVSVVSYLGNTLRYDVEVAGGLVLKADVRDPWHHEPLGVGREVAASFPASVTLAVADDS